MKAVIFDCDGVLINSEELGAQALKEIFNEHGLHYTAEERMDLFAGRATADMVATISADYRARNGNDLPADFFEQLQKRYRNKLDRQMAAIDGVVELLTALRQARVPVAVASNGEQDRLELKLRQVGLYDLLEPHIYSKDNVARPKPAPDVYEYAAVRLGVDPADCIVVEDSQIGTMAGVAAGSRVLGFAAPFIEVSDMEARLKKAGAAETFPSMRVLGARIFELLGLSGPDLNRNNGFPAPPAP